MPSEEGSEGPPYGTVVRRCKCEGCDWEIRVQKIHPEDNQAVREADEKAELHFDRQHRGEARIKVVLEREVSPHPDQELQAIIDRYHDRVADDPPAGFEVAYAVGEMVQEPDACIPEDATDHADGGEQDV